MAANHRVVLLPAQPTPLIGRRDEIDRVCKLLGDEIRLVTLVGTGGSGKTRLAIAVAEAIAPSYLAGAVFVDLSAAPTATEVMGTIARGLGLRDLGSRVRLDGVAQLIGDRKLLLVLDNFEHVLGAAPQVAELLADCAGLKVLVTSRAPLRLRWEHEIPVEPLQMPQATSECLAAEVASVPSVALFVARAGAARPDFVLTDDNAAAVAAICRRLDGLPLAIELAAARIKLLSPGALLRRLDDRLSVLTHGAPEVPSRLRSLRGALDWSYELLTPAEQTLFRRLSVFSGTFSDIAVQSLFGNDRPGEALDSVADLVDHSLLRVHPQPEGVSRLSMLETVREYATERLVQAGDAEATRQHHARLFLELAEAAEPYLSSAARDQWVRQLDLDYENLRSALAWFIEHGAGPEACRLAGALRMFWAFDGRVSEGRQWAERSLSAIPSGESPVERLKALQSGGHTAWLQGDNHSARRWLAEAVSLARQQEDWTALATALLHLAFVLDEHAEVDGERPQEEALRLFRDMADDWGTALALLANGQLALAQGKSELGRMHLEQALDLWQTVGDGWFTAQTFNVLGDVARSEGEYERAFQLYSRSLGLLRQQEARGNLASVLHNLGYVAYHRRQLAEAVRQFSAALDLFVEHADHRGTAECVLGLAVTLSSRHRDEDAARLFGAAEAMFASAGTEQWPINVETVRAARASTQLALGAARFAQLIAAGRAMSLDSVPRYARATIAAPDVADKSSALTRREREIAHLLVAGYTNRQLAETLVISEQTVETHVKRILGKLELHSRYQLASVEVPA